MKIHLVYLLIAFSLLQGCATQGLWKLGTHEVQVAKKIVKGNELFVQKEQSNICVSFYDKDGATEHKMRYLSAKAGQGFAIDFLTYVFDKKLNIDVLSVDINVQDHTNINNSKSNSFLFDVLFVLPNEPVTFQAYNEKSYPLELLQGEEKYLNSRLLEAVLTKQYFNKFRDPAVAFYAFAWVDRSGVMTHVDNPNISNENHRLVVKIRRPTDTKYIAILDFDADKYKEVGSNSTPKLIANYYNDSAVYEFAQEHWPIELSEFYVDTSCKEGIDNYKKLTDQDGYKMQIVFSKFEQKRVPLLFQIIGTPFALVFDIVTYPVQVYASSQM